jgi:hypothetical protein
MYVKKHQTGPTQDELLHFVEIISYQQTCVHTLEVQGVATWGETSCNHQDTMHTMCSLQPIKVLSNKVCQVQGCILRPFEQCAIGGGKNVIRLAIN